MNIVRSGSSTSCQVDDFESHIEKFFELLKEGIHFIESKQSSGPRFKVDDFFYKELIDNHNFPFDGASDKETMADLSQIIEGSIRSQSNNAVYNMVPQPTPETQAAASLMLLYNVNAIMDTYGGKSLLFEQQVARFIGNLVGWDKAFGTSCSGGKVTLFYAIKSAICRISPNSINQGVPQDLVILTSEGAHYSIEHVCEFLGLGRQSVVRIPISSSNGISGADLTDAFLTQIKNGKRVAAIIACGGTTLDFVCDNTEVIFSTVEKIVNHYNLNYTPYLHLDSVIGWLWFSLIHNAQDYFDRCGTSPSVVGKLKQVTDKFSYIHRFDSLGVDFHKNALCPYSSSFFITNGSKFPQQETHLAYGEFVAFTHTIENSRSAAGIASAWAALNSLGLNGLRDYLCQLLESAQKLKICFGKQENITVLNNSSCGWEIIFNFKPSQDLVDIYSANGLHEGFYQFITSKVQRGQNIPSISIITNFRRRYGSELGHGFIYYNMRTKLNSDECEIIIGEILKLIVEYENEVRVGYFLIENVSFIDPIK